MLPSPGRRRAGQNPRLASHSPRLRRCLAHVCTVQSLPQLLAMRAVDRDGAAAADRKSGGRQNGVGGGEGGAVACSRRSVHQTCRAAANGARRRAVAQRSGDSATWGEGGGAITPGPAWHLDADSRGGEGGRWGVGSAPEMHRIRHWIATRARMASAGRGLWAGRSGHAAA